MTVAADSTLRRSPTILEVVDFVVQNFPSYTGQERKIEQIVRQHMIYRTIGCGSINGKLAYVLIYDIDHEWIATVKNLIIRKDLRGKPGLIRYVTAIEWKKWPQIVGIRFKRELKGKFDYREYNLRKMFKAKEFSDGWEDNNSATDAASGS